MSATYQQRAAVIMQAPKLLFNIRGSLKTQQDFLKKEILPGTERALAGDGSFDRHDNKKITNYYGLAVPAILGEAFCLLRGKPMSDKERMASTCQGAMTGLFDDFFDKNNLSEASLKQLLEHPGEFKGNSNEMLFTGFYSTALNKCLRPQDMLHRLWKVYAAQVESKEQAGNHLPEERIKAITLNKGGHSLLFYRSAFDHELNYQEEKLLFLLGGLMQLSNDIFDVYKDEQHDILTLVTGTRNIPFIRELFLELLQEGRELTFRSGFSANGMRRFWALLSMGIFSRCHVCLDQLESLQRSTGNVFTIDQYSRKDMVCDMELTANKLRSLRYHFKYGC